MSKTKLVSTIPYVDRKGRVLKRRRETNEEIMQNSFLHLGKVRLLVGLRIWCQETKNYLGWHGFSITVEAADPMTAKKFRERMSDAIVDSARGLDVTVRRTQMVQGRR
jgi:hypothetical protein